MKKLFSFIISLSIFFNLMPHVSLAVADMGDLIVHKPSSWEEVGDGGSLWNEIGETGHSIDITSLPETGGTITVPESVREISITGDGKTISDAAIKVLSDCNVTLTDVTLVSPAGQAAFTGAGNSRLIIVGLVNLTGVAENPAIAVPEGTTLLISGRGDLTATAQDAAAGIGGGSLFNAGNIIIESINALNAKAANGGAGIGAGFGKNFQSIVIRGGSITAEGGVGAAGIGGGDTSSGGMIIITGGSITAVGGVGAAGIGGGRAYSGLKMYISGGNIDSTGGEQGAGIGTGINASPDLINISGGTITASGGQSGAGIGGGNASGGGNINISGGTINCGSYEGGAGIGGGAYGNGGNITIREGNIYAAGGQYGAGVGGGSNGGGGTVVISGSKLTARGANGAAGIGGGYNASGADVTIYNGEITASGGVFAAGIGGGYSGANSSVSIYGGNITASGGSGAAGIGGGFARGTGTVTIESGVVTATGGENGAGIGGGQSGAGANVTIRGGRVNAVAGSGAAGIGCGTGSTFVGSFYVSGGSIDGSLSERLVSQNNKNSKTDVYKLKVICTDESEEAAPCEGISIVSGNYVAETDSAGEAFIYLPAGQAVINAYSDGMESDAVEIDVLSAIAAGAVNIKVHKLEAPEITSEASFECSDFDGGSFQIESTGGKNKKFHLEGEVPEGCVLNENTGLLTVSPGTSFGSYTFDVRVSNTVAPDAVQNFSLIITDASAPIIGEPMFTPDGFTDEKIIVSFEVIDGNLDRVGAEYNGEGVPVTENGDGIYSFFASVDGIYKVTASDSLGNMSEKEMTVNTVDSDIPEITSLTADDSPTNTSVAVNAEISDSHVSKVWLIDANGSVSQMTALEDGKYSLDVGKNGKYSVLVLDKGGHITGAEIEIDNIYSETPLIPTISSSETEGGIRLSATVGSREDTPQGILYYYRWQESTGGDYTDIPGANSAEYLYDVTYRSWIKDKVSYRLIVTDNYGNEKAAEVRLNETIQNNSVDGRAEAVPELTVGEIEVEYSDTDRIVLSIPSVNTVKTSYKWYFSEAGQEPIEVTASVDGDNIYLSEKGGSFVFSAENLDPGTEYVFRVVVADEDGNSVDKSINVNTGEKISLKNQFSYGVGIGTRTYMLIIIIAVLIVLILAVSFSEKIGKRKNRI